MFSIPNKPPISLTPRAVSHIKLLMDNSDALALRVGVKKGGCAGMEYTIEYHIQQRYLKNQNLS